MEHGELWWVSLVRRALRACSCRGGWRSAWVFVLWFPVGHSVGGGAYISVDGGGYGGCPVWNSSLSIFNVSATCNAATASGDGQFVKVRPPGDLDIALWSFVEWHRSAHFGAYSGHGESGGGGVAVVVMGGSISVAALHVSGMYAANNSAFGE